MIDIVRTIWTNLQRWQKIALILVLQLIFLIIIAATLNLSLKDRNHIIVADDSDQTKDMPAAAKEAYKEVLWDIIEANVENVDKSIINDAVIREDSYKEEVDDESGAVQVNFLVDIDSIRQTYRVVLGWDKGESKITTPQIGCPMPALGETTKYPDSFCQGTYRNTDDLSLYLPYIVESPYENAAPNIYIDAEEDKHIITVMLTTCDTDSNKKKAEEYLNNIPTISDYEINFTVSGLDAQCD